MKNFVKKTYTKNRKKKWSKDAQILKFLKGSVIYYKDPTKPVAEGDWEVLKSK